MHRPAYSKMPGQEHAFPLLSLPQLPLEAVVKCLDQHEKQNMAAACRSLATAVSMASKNTKVTVRSSTGWKGLSKVLAARTIACKKMLICSNEPFEHETTDVNSALDAMLKPDQAPGCSFPEIQQIYIRARPLYSLLPINTANLLPDLKELSFFCDAGQYVDVDDLQPIPYCSSLRKLIYIAWDLSQIQLPGRYHTSEDLRRQLPNVESLELMVIRQGRVDTAFSCFDTMVNAWGKQLTELKLDTRTALIQLQQCTRLQHLSGNGQHIYQFPHSLPQSLTSLKLCDEVMESALQPILLLPMLRVLSISSFAHKLAHDWSQHPCTWQKLKVTYFHMEDLSKLPLHSLTGKGCLEVTYLELPDPMLPDSLANVMHAAQCVRNANIMIEELWDWECSVWQKDQLRPEVDIASAELFCAASIAVQPLMVYQPDNYIMHKFSRTKAAIINWMSPTLQTFNILGGAGTEPWFWKALRCCTELDDVIFQNVILNTQHADSIITLVLQAAKHLVAVTRRPIMLEFTVSRQGSQEDMQMATSHILLRLSEQLPDCVTVKKCVWDPKSYLYISLSP